MVCFSIHSQVTIQPKNNAAQELMEWKVLIRAMFLAREKGADAKVVDRKMIISDNTCHVNNIPEEFRPPPTVPAVG